MNQYFYILVIKEYKKYLLWNQLWQIFVFDKIRKQYRNIENNIKWKQLVWDIPFRFYNIENESINFKNLCKKSWNVLEWKHLSNLNKKYLVVTVTSWV